MEIRRLHKLHLTRTNSLSSDIESKEIYLFATDGHDAEAQASEIIGNDWYIMAAENTVANIKSEGDTSPIIINVSFVHSDDKRTTSVIGYMSDNTSEKLFEFDPNEIAFTSGELIGLTATDAKQIYHDKDVEFLRS